MKEENIVAEENKKSKSVFQKVKNIFFKEKSQSVSSDMKGQKSKNKKAKKKKDKGKKNKKKNRSETQKVDIVSTEKIQNTDNKKFENDKNIEAINLDTKKDFNVSEIFYSIQGESTFAGLPCVFIRFQGCNLRCSWCDTPYALNVKKEKKRMSLDQILEKVKKYDCKNICITGGEPLMQKKTPDLLSILCNNGYTVSLETNGFYSLKDIDKRVSKIVDFKCPGSKMQKKNNFENIEHLTRKDEVKFVIKDKEDYNWAKKIIIKHQLPEKVNSVLLSPVFGKLEAKQLSKWMTKDNLNARLQLQLHKYIWNPKKKGV